jgi:hypothetical protein
MHTSRVPPPVVEAVSVKEVIKQVPPARGFLQRGFLNPSPTGQVSPIVPAVLPSTLVVKEDEVVGSPSHLGRCISTLDDKGEDLWLNGLIEFQKWPVGFGPFGEVVVWD